MSPIYMYIYMGRFRRRAQLARWWESPGNHLARTGTGTGTRQVNSALWWYGTNVSEPPCGYLTPWRDLEKQHPRCLFGRFRCVVCRHVRGWFTCMYIYNVCQESLGLEFFRAGIHFKEVERKRERGRARSPAGQEVDHAILDVIMFYIWAVPVLLAAFSYPYRALLLGGEWWGS